MRALFWSIAALGLILIGRQIWAPDSHFLVQTQWVAPYGVGLGALLAMFGGVWGWKIASRPLRKHERDQLDYDTAQIRIHGSPHGGRLPSSQIPSLLLFCLGFVSWGGAGFYAVPVASVMLVGESQVTAYEVVGLDYSNRASGFRVRADAMTVSLRNVPSAIFLEAELGDTVLVVGQGTRFGQYYDTLELR